MCFMLLGFYMIAWKSLENTGIFGSFRHLVSWSFNFFKFLTVTPFQSHSILQLRWLGAARPWPRWSFPPAPSWGTMCQKRETRRSRKMKWVGRWSWCCHKRWMAPWIKAVTFTWAWLQRAVGCHWDTCSSWGLSFSSHLFSVFNLYFPKCKYTRCSL